jgi:hypothetical protein
MFAAIRRAHSLALAPAQIAAADDAAGLAKPNTITTATVSKEINNLAIFG